MNALLALAVAVGLLDVAMIIRNFKRSRCQRCCRPWAIYSRQQMHVCKSCRNEIDARFRRALAPSGYGPVGKWRRE